MRLHKPKIPDRADYGFFEKLKVGKWVWFQDQKRDSYPKYSMACQRYGQKLGRIFSIQNALLGFRIWRVK